MDKRSAYKVTVENTDNLGEATLVDVTADSFREALWLAYGRMLEDDLRQQFSGRPQRWKFR